MQTMILFTILLLASQSICVSLFLNGSRIWGELKQLKKTTSKSNPNFDYIDKIITDWHDRKLLNSEDVKNYLLEFKNKTNQIKELEKKTGYQNYDQRNIDNFDKFYANN